MTEKVEIIEIDAGNATKTLKELKDEVKNLRKELDNCEIGSDKFVSTLEELTSAQTELKNATKTSTDAIEGSYDSLVNKMSELKKVWRSTADEAERADLGSQIAEINSQLKTMDAEIGNYQRNVGDYGSAFDDVTLKIEGGVAKFERFNNASRAIIGSFDLVEGGLKAIGVESEEVNALMDSMQGAMMLTNGLNSVKEGVQAFTALRASVMTATTAQTALNIAMLANPIGLIVAAVAALTAGITALVVVMKKNRDEEKLLKEAYEATNRAIEDRIDAQDLEIQLMEARGEAQKDILQQEKAYAETNLEITKKRIEAIEKELESTTGLRRKKKKLLEEQLNDLKEQLEDQEEAVKNANNAILIYDVKTQTEQRKQAEETAREKSRLAKEAADKEIAEQKRIIEEVNKLYNKQKEDRVNYWLSELQLRQKQLDEWEKTEKETVRKQYANKAISEAEYLDQIFQIDLIYADKKKKLDEDAATASEEYFIQSGAAVVEATKKQQIALKDAVGLVSTAISQTSTLLTTLANTQDKTSKEGFKAYKNLAIASATMSMLQGIISSWTSAMSLPAPLSFITGGVMSAFSATLGGIQIDQIKRQKFDGNSTTGAAASVPAVNTAALLSTPVNYTSEIRGATAIEDATDTRVYVVESDITDTIRKVAVAEDESMF